MGLVFSIEEFSIYDGPGIRTTVFLKGCPLRCSWCHNPEGLSPQREILRTENGCTGCGNCVKFSDESGFSEQSIIHCPHQLLRYSGTEYTPAALCEKLLKNADMLTGITFSGGEPLLQADFVCDCLEILAGKLDRAVQTSGFAPEKDFARVLSRADRFLFDIKLVDEAAHRYHTGVSNTVIHKNLEALVNSGKPFVLRLPLIPAVTDTEENISEVIELMTRLHVGYIELLPYNTMAGSKYTLAGRTFSPKFDDTKPYRDPSAQFAAAGIETKVL